MNAIRLPRVIVDEADPPEHAAWLHQVHAPYDGGALVIELIPRSHRTSYSLAAAGHAALGKTLPSSGTRATATDVWVRLMMWTQALAVEHIVVARAHLRSRRAWEDLAQLATFARAQLWLVVSGTSPSRGQQEFARDWGARLEQFEELAARVPVPADTRLATTGPAFPPVPHDEFPTFLASCLQVHDGPEAAVIKHAYWETFDSTLTTLNQQRVLDEDLLTSLIGDIGRTCHGDFNGNLTRLRALQAAAFRHQFLVGIDADALAAGYTSQQLATASPQNLRKTRSIADPRSAALAVLALCTHQPPPVLAEMNLDDVDAGASHVRLAGLRIAIPEDGQAAVRAHWLHRLWQGATEDDPLFVSEDRSAPDRSPKRTETKGLQQRLRATSRLTGLVLTSRESWGQDQAPKRWLARRKVTLTHLGETPAC